MEPGILGYSADVKLRFPKSHMEGHPAGRFLSDGDTGASDGEEKSGKESS
jgi:hypothetical protein